MTWAPADCHRQVTGLRLTLKNWIQSVMDDVGLADHARHAPTYDVHGVRQCEGAHQRGHIQRHRTDCVGPGAGGAAAGLPVRPARNCRSHL